MIFFSRFLGRVLLCVAVLSAVAAESPLGRFVGTPACASSSCHGGAGPRRAQSGEWESRDVHRRAASTLNSARSEQIARALGLTNAVGQARPADQLQCTVCHAPNATVPASQRRVVLDPTEGVGCETCHAPAESWLRSHTRPGPPRDDFTYQDKVAAGLRDLRDLRARANVCVACHENVDRAILLAGHPELNFELDGQTRQEPRHWVELPGFQGPQSWLVGQAVAAREVAWWMTREDQKSALLSARAVSLDWLVSRAAGALGIAATDPDTIARLVAGRRWTEADTTHVLVALAGAGREFRPSGIPAQVQAHRAERLVLGLDRLVAARPGGLPKTADDALNALFKRVQWRADFETELFANELDTLFDRLKTAGLGTGMGP